MKSISEEKPVLYVNIVLHDASEAVRAQVSASMQPTTKKNEPSLAPSFLKKAVADGAASLASQLATPTVVAAKMGAKLTDEMPLKMKEKGLTAVAEQVFLEGPYLVMQLQIQHVDSMVLAQANKASPGLLGWIEWFLRQMGQTHQKNLESEYLPGLIQGKMETTMNSVLAEKMQEKQIKADTLVLAEAQQARFFYATLRQVREAAAAKAGPPPPLKTIRQRIRAAANGGHNKSK